jgi:hypothetical protein
MCGALSLWVGLAKRNKTFPRPFSLSQQAQATRVVVRQSHPDELP